MHTLRVLVGAELGAHHTLVSSRCTTSWQRLLMDHTHGSVCGCARAQIKLKLCDWLQIISIHVAMQHNDRMSYLCRLNHTNPLNPCWHLWLSVCTFKAPYLVVCWILSTLFCFLVLSSFQCSIHPLHMSFLGLWHSYRVFALVEGKCLGMV